MERKIMETITQLQEKKEEDVLRQYFKDKVNSINLKDFSIIEYLKESLNSDDKYCKGWDYLKENLTEEFKQILFDLDFYKAYYQSSKVDYILNQFYTTDEINELDKEIVKQLGSWVYVWNDIKREYDKKQDEDILRKDLLSKGFKEQVVFEFDRVMGEMDLTEELKKLNGLKVICVLDRDKIGIMGSFTEKGEYKGKLIYDERRECIIFLPQRHTKTGQIIRSKFYYKVL